MMSLFMSRLSKVWIGAFVFVTSAMMCRCLRLTDSAIRKCHCALCETLACCIWCHLIPEMLGSTFATDSHAALGLLLLVKCLGCLSRAVSVHVPVEKSWDKCICVCCIMTMFRTV